MHDALLHKNNTTLLPSFHSSQISYLDWITDHYRSYGSYNDYWCSDVSNWFLFFHIWLTFLPNHDIVPLQLNTRIPFLHKLVHQIRDLRSAGDRPFIFSPPKKLSLLIILFWICQFTWNKCALKLIKFQRVFLFSLFSFFPLFTQCRLLILWWIIAFTFLTITFMIIYRQPHLFMKMQTLGNHDRFYNSSGCALKPPSL